jgi:hypothetical protein
MPAKRGGGGMFAIRHSPVIYRATVDVQAAHASKENVFSKRRPTSYRDVSVPP